MSTMFLSVEIVEGDKKRALECYVDSRFFEQRKSYDEYYVKTPTVDFEFNVNDLMILAEHFKVIVNENSIELHNT